jgi:hypothetical protein
MISIRSAGNGLRRGCDDAGRIDGKRLGAAGVFCRNRASGLVDRRSHIDTRRLVKPVGLQIVQRGRAAWMVDEVRLGGRVGIFEILVGRGIVALLPVNHKLRDSDGGQYPDNGDDDHEFNQCETLLSSFVKNADHVPPPPFAWLNLSVLSQAKGMESCKFLYQTLWTIVNFCQLLLINVS